MADFYLKRGDNLSQIDAQLTDGLGVPVNLFGATVRFIMRSFETGQVIFINDAEITEPIAGMVAYVWSENDDIIPAGDYYAEWQVTKQGASNQTFPTRGYHLVSILDDLDSPSLTPQEFKDIRMLRGMVAERDQEPYSDSVLKIMMLRNEGDIYATAAEIWREKSAIYSELVDVSESGNSQKLSQLYRNAEEQAAKYLKASARGGFGDESGSATAGGITVTRPIVRL